VVCFGAAMTAVGQTATQQKMSAATPAAAKVNDKEVAPTRLDLLRGAYGEDRANNDLISYHLDIRVDPEKKYVSGKEYDSVQDVEGWDADTFGFE
jgi:hypothetical protein